MTYKKISLLLALFIIGTSANLSAQIKTYNEIGSELPQLKIEVSASKVVTNKDLTSKVHLLLIIVNPTCSHCIEETKLICENAKLFNNSKVVFMIENSRVAEIPEFKTKTGLDNHPEFITGTDQLGTIEKLPNEGLLPHILIYDKAGKLVNILNGNITAEDFKQLLP